MKNIFYKIPVSIFVALLWILLTGCLYDPKRNSLVFKDSAIKVEEAIIQMNNLLNKIPAEITNYFFDNNNYFFVNNVKLFKVIDNNFTGIDTVSVLKNLTIEEKRKFVSIVIFLRENYITGTYKDNIFGHFMYDYRSVSGGEWNDMREIFYFDKQELIEIESEYEKMKILDHKENIYLVSFIDKKDPY
jgi:hypothetical protein